MYTYLTTDAYGNEIFRDARGALHKKLDRCPHCGAEPVMSYDTSVDLCDECYRRYKYFYVQRSKVTRDSRLATMQRFYDAIIFYISLRDDGVTYKVPGNLDNLKEKLEVFIASKKAGRPLVILSKFEYFAEPMYCKDCGELVEEGVRYTSRIRCANCARRYKRYQQLTSRITALTKEECNELNGILDVYKEQMQRNRWSPNIPVIRKKVRDRLEEL